MSYRCDSTFTCSRTKHISNNVCKLNFQTVIRFTEDVAALLKMLVLFDQEGQAVLLQTNFQQLIRTIETSISIIWPPEETSNNVNHVSQVCKAQRLKSNFFLKWYYICKLRNKEKTGNDQLRCKP